MRSASVLRDADKKGTDTEHTKRTQARAHRDGERKKGETERGRERRKVGMPNGESEIDNRIIRKDETSEN